MLLVAGLGALALGAAPAPVALADHLTLTPVGEGAWRVSAEPWHANGVVVQMADGRVVLVDTPPTPGQTRMVLDWIEGRWPGAAVVAVNSHHHADAAAGNAVLREAGVPIYGGSRTPTEMAARSAGMTVSLRESFADDPRMSAELAALQWAPPDHVFPVEGELVLRFGEERLVLLHPGAAHSADNIVAWFPERRLLFGGCMVKDGDSLGYMGEADVVSWGPAVARLQALGAEVVVPGHGPRTDAGLLENTARLVGAAVAER